MNNLRFTLKFWPASAAGVIALCFLTKTVSEWCGVDLPDQANIALVKNCLLRAFDSGRAFAVAAFLVAQVILIMPALEELVFRGLLFKLPRWIIERKRPAGTKAPMVISSFLFSAAHYIAQPWPDAAFLALFAFGCAQCWLYRRTDRLWCAMLNHALFNLTNLVLLFVIPE